MAIGHETQGVEFKGPFARTDKDQFAKVVRAILGMANHRDGGLVIVGIDEHDDGSGKTLRVVGMTPDERQSWDQDAVLSSVNSYADPFVELNVEPIQHDGKHLIAIRVREFAELPVLCKKPFMKQAGDKREPVLREGACYVRRRGRIESSEIPTHVEMRELLDLSTEKGIRRFLKQAHHVGLGASPTIDDTALFDAQRGTFR